MEAGRWGGVDVGKWGGGEDGEVGKMGSGGSVELGEVGSWGLVSKLFTKLYSFVITGTDRPHFLG